MKRLPILTAAIICAFALSCTHSGTTGLSIPRDALIVLHINTSSITSKLSWKEIRETSWFQDMKKEGEDSTTRKILDNPETSGIDLKAGLAYFMKKQGQGGYMAFEGGIRDAAAFETMVKNEQKASTVHKDGDLNYVEASGKCVIGWTSSRFFVLSDAPMLGMNPMAMNRFPDNHPSFGTDSLRKFAKDLLSLNSDNNIDHDARFASLVGESGDVHFWINTDEYTNSMAGGMLSMLKLGSLLQGNVSTFTLNFEDGKIAIKSKQYFGEEMKKLMDKYKSRNVDAALLSRIPSQDVAAVMAFNCAPEQIREFLKASGLDGMANGFLGQVNYSTDELVNALGGQFLFTITDLKMQKTQVRMPFVDSTMAPVTTTKPDMNFLFAASVHDRPSFEKLLNIVKSKMGEGLSTSGIDFKVNNDWFALSNRPGTVDHFLAGGSNKMPFADKITGHPFGMYVDLQRIIRTGQQQLDNAADSARFNASIALWQDVVATGGGGGGKTMTGDITINLVDKSTNSLKQLNQYAEKMSAAKKLERARNMNAQLNDLRIDTTTAVALPIPQSN